MISIAIMAHPDRAKFIPYLHERLGYECPVAWERGLGRRDTGKRAWLLHDPAATHHLVLQDDVILSQGLPEALARLVAVIKDQPISLYCQDRLPVAKLIDRCRVRPEVRWLLLQALNWGPAILLPVPDIAPMLAWTAKHCFMPNYDAAIAYFYLAACGRPVWYTMPSLVDHRTEGESLVWSLAGQDGRAAGYFLGENRSGADLDWQGEAVWETTSRQVHLRRLMLVNETWRLHQTGAPLRPQARERQEVRNS